MSQLQGEGYPETVDDFRRVVGEFQATDRFRKPLLFAVGGRVFTANRTLASVRYPVVNGPEQSLGVAAVLMKVLDVPPEGVQNTVMTTRHVAEALRYLDPFSKDGLEKHPNIRALVHARAAHEPIATFIFDDVAPVGVEDSTLKLYGLSWRHFRPGGLNLDRIFTKLPNVAWRGDTPMDEYEVDEALFVAAFGGGQFAPHMVDKFPLYVHRIRAAKMGVRITDQHKVRLGAHLGEGTTLMPGASYINFNAGTDGDSMVEGRISSSGFVGKGTAVGGGASMLGTLSGGNDIPISTGRNCLLEANCVLGIPIGDAVIIAAETAVLASTMVVVRIEGHRYDKLVLKARQLAGLHAITFRRNSQTGEVEVVRTRRNLEFARKLEDGESILNSDLHRNR